MVKGNGNGGNEEKKEQGAEEVEKEVDKEVEEAVKEIEDLNNLEGDKVVKKAKVKKAKASKRSKHSDDFKKKVIKEKEGGATYADLKKKHGVYASQIVTWKKQLKA